MTIFGRLSKATLSHRIIVGEARIKQHYLRFDASISKEFGSLHHRSRSKQFDVTKYSQADVVPLLSFKFLCIIQARCRTSGCNGKDINSLVQPVQVKDHDGVSVGEELAGSLKKGTIRLIY